MKMKRKFKFSVFGFQSYKGVISETNGLANRGA